MNFAVVNLGCKVNRVESDAAAAQLLAAGMHATDANEADLVVVNTCTVTGEAEKKTRKAVRRALRANGHSRLIVTGCAAAIDAATYKAMDGRVQVVPKARLAETLREATAALSQEDDMTAAGHGGSDAGAGKSVSGANADIDAGRCSSGAAHQPAGCASSPDDADLPVALRTGAGFPTRVGVKVQDGCNNACTYCIVHVARGRATSRPAAEIVAECTAYARAGVREIVLTGINLGSYCDRSPDAGSLRLADLLRLLLQETAEFHDEGELPCRFRISSIEPRDVNDDLVQLLAQAQGRVCRHLHLPLQAGSDRVLREMARPYRAADYLALVKRLRAACPSLALSTDVIVGFPGETDADFGETLSLARRCGFSKMHVFPYSRRAGTPAAARADQVPEEVKARRARELRVLADELRAVDFARRAGTTELALVESAGTAMTESYYEIQAPAGAPVGALVSVEMG